MQTEPRQNPLLALVRKEGRVIAAHHSLLRAGGVSSRDYVQDAAFLFFDGVENVGRGRHSSTAAAWVNLTGGPNAVGVYSCNASWTADSLSFTETGNYRADLSSVTWPSGGITFEVVFRQNQYGTWAGRIIQTRDDNYKRIDVCARAADSNTFGKQIVYAVATPYDVALSKANPPIAQTFAIVGSTTSSGFSFRYAGQTETKSTSNALSQKPPDFTIGGNYNNTRNFLGEVCAVRVHSRALTEAEIDFNAALDRKRFGVT